MNGEGQQIIVVGVSGSHASGAALQWAADEARRRNARLRIVRSWEPPHRAPYAMTAEQPTPAQQRNVASQDLAATMNAAFGTTLPAGVETELAEGSAERTLVEQSLNADLLVLGAVTQPALLDSPIGPVVRTCLSHAHCPVVVVNADAGCSDDHQPAGTRSALPAPASLDAGRLLPSRPDGMASYAVQGCGAPGRIPAPANP
jgi:nucleotide-binding universal stress UspA family protein